MECGGSTPLWILGAALWLPRTRLDHHSPRLENNNATAESSLRTPKETTWAKRLFTSPQFLPHGNGRNYFGKGTGSATLLTCLDFAIVWHENCPCSVFTMSISDRRRPTRVGHDLSGTLH